MALVCRCRRRLHGHRRRGRRRRGRCGRVGRKRGNGGGSDRPEPPYNKKYEEVDGGGPRINHREVEFSEEWDYTHQSAWKRSKMYDEDHAKGKIQQAQNKAWVAAGSKGPLRTWGTVSRNLPWRKRKQRSRRR